MPTDDVDPVMSENLLRELVARLLRPKFDRYATRERRELYLGKLKEVGTFVGIGRVSLARRDPDDDGVIETALVGQAQVIVTGDEDLSSMPPRPGFRVLAP